MTGVTRTTKAKFNIANPIANPRMTLKLSARRLYRPTSAAARIKISNQPNPIAIQIRSGSKECRSSIAALVQKKADTTSENPSATGTIQVEKARVLERPLGVGSISGKALPAYMRPKFE